MSNEETKTQWATVEIMGHDQTAGRITMENGWLRVDVPAGETFRTEYIGRDAIFRIRIVSEDIARAYVPMIIDAQPYDAPIVTREQYMSDMEKARREMDKLSRHIRELEARLVAVNALPEHISDDDEDDLEW